MQIRKEMIKGAIILRFSGQLALTNVKVARETALPLINGSHTEAIVFDMTNVSTIDSSGIGFLVTNAQASSIQNRTFVLFGCNDRLMTILHATNIHRIVSLFQNESEAIEGIRGAHVSP